MIDYRLLLIKYMQHVVENEGITFLKEDPRDGLFTHAEWEELVQIEIDHFSNKDTTTPG